MSLKSFHIVFVSICTLLFLFLALWSFALAPEKSAVITALGVIGAVGAVLMPVYGVCFYRKAARIHI
jgi:multidrug transporter EmrE-like cation transporter